MLKAISYALLGLVTFSYGLIFIHETYQRTHSSDFFVTPLLATLVFGLVTWFFSRTISRFIKPWWAAIPLLLFLLIQFAMLGSFAAASLTNPDYSPRLELLPFFYWILSGLGVFLSYILLSISRFFGGYRETNPGSTSNVSRKSQDH